MSKVFFITTPIYYINAPPHIGHAYTTIAADILHRFKKGRGEASYFLTGTDEHGLKIERAAKAEDKSAQAYADDVSQSFRELWKHLDVVYDDFIRTTEPRHEARVAAAVRRLYETRDIYKGKYSGYYCVSCEAHWTETDLQSAAEAKGGPKTKHAAAETRCPDCGKPIARLEEESYFFALSKYRDRLLALYRERPEFLQPAHRANEILRFVEAGLRDLSVSRSRAQVAWGVPLPFDPRHTVYVWFDALLNYVSAAGWRPEGLEAAALDGERPERPPFAELWPADVQLVGKEIYRFHAVIWPAMLMALELPLSRTVFAHGWWTFEGEKMSKSKGNIVRPEEITREFGVDALRYFLFREMPFGNDGAFSREAFRARYNADLADGIGNLLSRVVTMADKYLGGELPRRPKLERPFLSKEVADESRAIAECMERLAFCEALTRIWTVISRLDETIEKEKPWTLAKTEPERLKFLLFELVWSLRIIAGWLEPFMPQTSAKMQMQLGVRRPSASWSAEEVLEGSASAVHKGPPLFPRK